MLRKKHTLLIIGSVCLISVICLVLQFSTYRQNGYQWKCLNKDHYISHVHKFSNTAVTKANAHAAKYGHKVTIYEHD
jgi:hypothetical protein